MNDLYIFCHDHRVFRYLNKESSEHFRHNLLEFLIPLGCVNAHHGHSGCRVAIVDEVVWNVWDDSWESDDPRDETEYFDSDGVWRRAKGVNATTEGSHDAARVNLQSESSGRGSTVVLGCAIRDGRCEYHGEGGDSGRPCFLDFFRVEPLRIVERASWGPRRLQ